MDEIRIMRPGNTSVAAKRHATERITSPLMRALPFLLPALIIYVALIIYPIGNAFVMSFFAGMAYRQTKNGSGFRTT